MTYRITIPNWHPVRINTLLSTHPKGRSRLKRIDANLVAAYGLRIPRATTKRTVRITIQLEPRQRGADPDNYLKSTLDALVKAKLLIDDSRKWCRCEPVEFVRGKNRQTVIELIEPEGEP